jgi:hypothetical protein
VDKFTKVFPRYADQINSLLSARTLKPKLVVRSRS